MKNLIDVHTHSISSGHAYSTIQENIEQASIKGLKYYGISDHGPKMPGGAHTYFFSNLKVMPRVVDGVTVLRGIEANILNINGDLDVNDTGYKMLDYIIASIHVPCFGLKHSSSEILQTYENVCKNPYVVVIGHPDDGRFSCDYEKFVDICKENNTLIEINNSSLNPTGFRENCLENSKKILEFCKKKRQPVIMSSDAHVSFDVGNFSIAEKLLSDIDFPKELIVNYNEELIEKYFLKK
ncbi:MAG: phosphatase [Anaerorhabdus sp.]